MWSKGRRLGHPCIGGGSARQAAITTGKRIHLPSPTADSKVLKVKYSKQNKELG